MSILPDIRRYAAVAWRHRWKALLVAWIVCLLGWGAVHMIPNSYRSTARIYADADVILGQALRGIAVDGATASQVEVLQRTLLSRPNLERVVARTDLDLRVYDETSRDGLIQSLARQIRITPQTRNLFQIEYSDPDPRVAQAVVQTLLNLFIERATGNDRQQMENARNFIGQQIAAYEVQLREAEQRRADFRTRYIDLLPNENGGASRLEAARQRLAQQRGELQDARTRRALLAEQTEQTPATLANDAGASGAPTGRVADLERQLREAQGRFTERHPEVQALRQALAAARTGGDGGGRARPASVPNPLREQLRLRVLDVDGEIASLERQVRDEGAQVERLENLARSAPQLQAQLQNLDRDYNVIRRQYEELLGRRESLQVAGAARVGADQVRLEVVEPPTVPSSPTSPNRLLFDAGVLVLGLGAGAAIAALGALLDRGFHSTRDLRNLGLPVLGAITNLRPRRRTGPALAFGVATLLLVAAFGAVVAGGPVLTQKIPELVGRMRA
ncbi:XrtA system polysaccharide chain length determinant [Roseomonas sp. CCTCC AB2023176]|uniref:XrtA system polysaccharide chain length determinant n=1 Tax=Roseomonas sp. CCTCC AB2023176 TaxID=3342640 RepID=UPI0035D80D3B